MGDVKKYLETLSDEDRALVERVYDRARSVIPDLTEGTSYGMPCLKYDGRALISVMVTKNHIGVYPYSGSVITICAKELEGFRTTKGSVSFTAEKPLPDAAIDALVTARRDLVDAMTC
ncbi:MAG: DUF1801 domain-containing protein [Cellulomonadaceae bacterium]|jgi:uncharacterized protein YdhG (YjbR/CyaY superfamily)|nr:DUF1801 domain-containing protein [Cellulomonadaceae bacterium]